MVSPIITRLIRLLLQSLTRGSPSWTIDRLLLSLDGIFGIRKLDALTGIGPLFPLRGLFVLFGVELRSWGPRTTSLIGSASHIYTKSSRHLSVCLYVRGINHCFDFNFIIDHEYYRRVNLASEIHSFTLKLTLYHHETQPNIQFHMQTAITNRLIGLKPIEKV